MGRSPTFPIGKKSILPARSFFFDHLNRALPTFDLRRVQLSKVEHPALDRPTPAYPNTLSQRVVNMLLAILATNMTLQKHFPSLPNFNPSAKPLVLHTHPFHPLHPRP